MKFLTTTIIFLLTIATLSAQQRNNSYGRLGSIIKNNELTGYYLYSATDVVAKGMYEYKLELLDENLNTFGEKVFTDEKGTRLIESTFNGSNLFFLFYRKYGGAGGYARPKVDLSYKIISPSGDLIANKKIEMSYKAIKNLSESMGNSEALESSFVYPISGHGFAMYFPNDNKKAGYTLRYFGNNGKTWKRGTSEDSKFYEDANFIGSDDKHIYSLMTRKRNEESDDHETYIIAHEIETGKRIYLKALLAQTENPVLPVKTYVDKNGKIHIMGYYFKQEEKFKLTNDILGITSFNIDKNGDIFDEKYISWEKFNQYLPANKKGKIDERFNVVIHNIYVDENSTYIIAERFDKVPMKGAGMMARATIAMVSISDLYIYEVDSDFKEKNLHIIPKFPNKVPVSHKSTRNPIELGYTLKSMNALDYNFTSYDKANNQFFVAYADYEKKTSIYTNSSQKKKWVYGLVIKSKDSSDFVVKKIELFSDQYRSSIYPAKPGHILISEWSKENGRSLRIENILK